MSNVIPIGSKVRKYRGGHAKVCECYSCLKIKLEAYRQRLALMNGKPPPSPHHSIPVAPHWRKRKTPQFKLSPFGQLVWNLMLQLQKQGIKNGPQARKAPRARRAKRRS